jgi:hypothetical protein
VLRQVAVGQSTPVRLPAFTALEEEALAAGWGTDTSEDTGVGAAAVARVSAALLADVQEANPLMPGGARIAHALTSLQTAQDRMRAMAKAIPEGDGEQLQKVRDLQKRLASGAARIQQLTGSSKPAAPPMKGVAATPVEKAFERLPNGPARWAILGGVPAVALVIFAVLLKVLLFPGDPARSAVTATPKMTVMGIRVVDLSEQSGKPVAVVDGSWFTANEDERTRMARIARQSVGKETLDVHDVRGRPLAHVKGMEVTLLPLPGPRD